MADPQAPTAGTAPTPPAGWASGRLKRWSLAASMVVVLLPTAFVFHPRPDPLLAVPTLVGLAGVVVLVVGWASSRRLVTLVACVVAAVTLIATTLWVADPARQQAGPWPLLQTVFLMILIGLLCRWAPVRTAVLLGGLSMLAEAALGLPVTGQMDGDRWELVAISGFWGLAGVFAAASGCYLRWLDGHRVRAVTHAYRTQRLQLATDLHDFVAHDVSAMVIQAQAAQMLLDQDPQAAARLLRQIEADGAQALTAMDRTIQVMRDLEADAQPGAGGPRTPVPGVNDLPELVDRFARTGAGKVELDADPGLERILSRETSATAYRIVVEALTNVRRHAVPGAAVTVTLRREDDAVVLTVLDRKPEDVVVAGFVGIPERLSGGSGLKALEQRVGELGGSFEAEPVLGVGWKVRARLPVEAGTGVGTR